MQTLTLLHSAWFPIADYADALKREAISPSRLDTRQRLPGDGNSLRVVLVDKEQERAFGGNGGLSLDARTADVGVGLAQQPKVRSDHKLYFYISAKTTA